MALRNALENIATESKQDSGNALLSSRLALGKLSAVATVTSVGDTTVLTPSAGKRLNIYWVYAINNPDAASSPRIDIKFVAGPTLYRAYAVAHAEFFVGAINQALAVNLAAAGEVAFTVHYLET